MYPWRLHPDKISQPTNSVNIIIKHSHQNAQIQIHPGKITRPTNWVIIIIKHCQLYTILYCTITITNVIISGLDVCYWWSHSLEWSGLTWLRHFSSGFFQQKLLILQKYDCGSSSLKLCSPERRWGRPTSRTSSSTSTSATSCPQSNQNATLWNFLECLFDLKT